VLGYGQRPTTYWTIPTFFGKKSVLFKKERPSSNQTRTLNLLHPLSLFEKRAFLRRLGREFAKIRVRNAKTCKDETSGRKGVFMRNRRLLQAFVGALAVVALGATMLFSLGCNNMLPTAPTEDPIHDFAAEQLWPAPPANLVGWLQPCSGEDSKLFGKNGGKLTVAGDCFELEFRVPRDALSDKVLISVQANLFNYWQNRELKKGLRFEFSPDGVVFAKPALIEFEAAVLGAKNGESLKLYYFNPQTGLWQLEQVILVRDASVEVKFEISHFSRYAIS
jgi:hypothetical protein